MVLPGIWVGGRQGLLSEWVDGQQHAQVGGALRDVIQFVTSQTLREAAARPRGAPGGRSYKHPRLALAQLDERRESLSKVRGRLAQERAHHQQGGLWPVKVATWNDTSVGGSRSVGRG